MNLLYLKKYKIFIYFKEGPTMAFETNMDIKKAKKQRVNGVDFIITEDMTTINVSQIKKIEIETRY